jgi:predicted transcriptional regulator
LEEQAGIGKLYFALASEVRLAILEQLRMKNLKTQEIARRLDLTSTEAVRQLQHLSEAELIQRQSDGSYTLTEYGKLEVQLSSSLEFVFKHRKYFLTHDVRKLPIQFVNRLGELLATSLVMDTQDYISKAAQIFTEAERYAWGMREREGSSAMVRPMFVEQVKRGVEFRDLFPEGSPSLDFGKPEIKQMKSEGRTLPAADTPALVLLTEKEAIISFRFKDGRMDFAGFFGKDPTFMSWVRDVYLFYWNKGKRAYAHGTPGTE